MLGIIVGWIFGGFIYFKIVFDSAFRPDISIVAALILGVILGCTVFIGSGIYANLFLPYNWTPGARPVSWGTLVAKSILPFLLIYMAYATLCRLVIFGFSKRLDNAIDTLHRDLTPRDDFIVYLLIVLAPVALHYAMCVFGTHNTANRRAS